MLMNNDVYRVWTSEKYRVVIVSPKCPLGVWGPEFIPGRTVCAQPAGRGVWRLTELPRLL